MAPFKGTVDYNIGRWDDKNKPTFVNEGMLVAVIKFYKLKTNAYF